MIALSWHWMRYQTIYGMWMKSSISTPIRCPLIFGMWTRWSTYKRVMRCGLLTLLWSTLVFGTYRSSLIRGCPLKKLLCRTLLSGRDW
ncbi:hypothetical protein RHMOL_Rhmol09G0095400 [Rhododendron molle]|uniref:Uncharacterized protein n=1 Tax=Rhododendron molle TaxID=49168 RepID=A0ACC0MD89_RHOML|nr:hypothetical protein RHMOL_Rhmol09G0095400 [Rhododendron molle]